MPTMRESFGNECGITYGELAMLLQIGRTKDHSAPKTSCGGNIIQSLKVSASGPIDVTLSFTLMYSAFHIL